MIPNGLPGLFIAVEGPDGNGKSTLTRKVKEAFTLDKRYWTRAIRGLSENLVVADAMKPIRVVETKEPGKDRLWGKIIYKELFKPGGMHASDPFGFQKWYALDSAQNLEKVIVPALVRGEVVISDRFRPSMVYGAETLDDIHQLMHMHEIIIGRHFIWPDIIIILDVPVSVSMERLAKKLRANDQYEKRRVLERVRRNYLLFADAYPNCHVINGDRTPEEILEDVMELIESMLIAKNILIR